MRIRLVAIGRARAGPEKQLFDHYRSRITQPFSLELKEVEEKRPLATADLKRREGELLLAQIPDGSVVVALDEKGKSLSSRTLADKLGRWRDEGMRDLVFLIGGADGLDESVRMKANLSLSLGTVTWPHMLVRGLVAEQIYRCQCILSGHPYHRE